MLGLQWAQLGQLLGMLARSCGWHARQHILLLSAVGCPGARLPASMLAVHGLVDGRAPGAHLDVALALDAAALLHARHEAVLQQRLPQAGQHLVVLLHIGTPGEVAPHRACETNLLVQGVQTV